MMISVAALISVIFSTDCEAQKRFEYNKNGYYGIYQGNFAITANQILVSRSFDGKSFIETDKHLINVPRIKPGAGLGAGFGLVLGDAAVWEFGYRFNISDYTTKDEDITGRATIHFIHFADVKWYFCSFFENKLMLFYNFDFSWAFYRFKDLAILHPNSLYPDDGKRLTTSFNGAVIGSGLGLQIKIGEKTAIELRSLPEYQTGTRLHVIDGEDGTYKVKNFGNFMLINTIGLRMWIN